MMKIDVFDEAGNGVSISQDPGSSFVELAGTSTAGATVTVYLEHDEAYRLSGACAAVRLGQADGPVTVHGTAGVVELHAPAGTVTVLVNGEVVIDDGTGTGNLVVVGLTMDGLSTASHALAAGASQI